MEKISEDRDKDPKYWIRFDEIKSWFEKMKELENNLKNE